MQKIQLFWFRRDLRLHDNTALFYALKENTPTLPIFIFDRNILDLLDDKDDARVSFIHAQIEGLKKQLQLVGSDLKVYYGTPIEVYKNIIQSFEVSAVYTNRDYEPYAKERDKSIDDLLKAHGIGFYTFKDQVIFEKDEILTDGGDPYKVFTPYKNKWVKKLESMPLQVLPDVSQDGNFFNVHAEEMISLESMGFAPSSIKTPPKEAPIDIIKKYDQIRNFPAINGTSRLGVHLRFGTLGIREMVKIAHANNETWLNELIWREFYMNILHHFPHVKDKAFKPQYDHIPWSKNEEHFQKWCEGKTGYPIVDAGMRELNATGYMHNRVRMITASFLTKHLLIDWRWGEAYFAKKLLDFELASNNGGWQWAAGTGTDAQPYFRVFNPDAQTEKFDKELKYIKKWLPEWGTSAYPKPIVEHKSARLRAIETYKKALGG